MLEAFAQIFTNPNFYANVLAVTPPILFAALGCAIAEKASVTNMGMEGIMLISSFCGTMASFYLGPSNPWAGLLVSMIVGALLGFLVSTNIFIGITNKPLILGFFFTANGVLNLVENIGCIKFNG